MSPDDDVAARLVLNATVVADLVGIRCPMCPACGGPPALELSALTWPRQAWCENDACSALMWVPTRSAREQLADAREVDLEDAPAPTTERDRPRRDDDYGAAAGQ